MGDQSHKNGSESLKNGANRNRDVDMGEDSAGGPTSSFNPSTESNGDEKITVVVPPTKGPRTSGDKNQETEGDVSMEGVEAATTELEAAGKAKAIQGRLSASPRIFSVSLLSFIHLENSWLSAL